MGDQILAVAGSLISSVITVFVAVLLTIMVYQKFRNGITSQYSRGTARSIFFTATVSREL